MFVKPIKVMKFYIADLHFGHTEILELDKRPVSNVEENERLLTHNWNEVVTNHDTVYVLGDSSYYGCDKTASIFRKLHGNKVFIRGNHDKWMNEYELRCKGIQFRDIITLDDYVAGKQTKVVVSHYPIAVWDKQFDGGYQLYGHIHLNKHVITAHSEMARSFNVGCMTRLMNYTPRTLEDIIIRSRTFKSQNGKNDE